MITRSLAWLVAAALVATNYSNSADAGHRHRCRHACGGQTCDYAPCENYQCCQPALQTVERTIMVPTTVTEMKTVQVQQCRTEQRQRNYTVTRQVPQMQEESYEYTVCVPRTQTKTVNYTVAKPVMNSVEQQYTVMVPYTETRQGSRQVCRLVAETRTRNVCVDQGHWEETVPTCDSPCAAAAAQSGPTAAVGSGRLGRARFARIGWRHRRGYDDGCAPCDSSCASDW